MRVVFLERLFLVCYFNLYPESEQILFTFSPDIPSYLIIVWNVVDIIFKPIAEKPSLLMAIAERKAMCYIRISSL